MAAPTHRLTDAHAAMASPNPSGSRREPTVASLRGVTFSNDTSAGIAFAPDEPSGSSVSNTTDALKGSWPEMENVRLSTEELQATVSRTGFQAGVKSVSVLANGADLGHGAALRPGGPAACGGALSPVKRLFDILVAGCALLLFAPLLMVVMVAIRTESPGPAIFRQRRTGYRGRVFTILKFRTMSVAEDCASVRQATRNDARVTPVGALLRKLSIDELPQLWNVMRGDMSIVGPRPHALAHDEYYGALIPTYQARFRAKPGLTGYAQVNGFRGEISDMRCMSDRVAADNSYIEEWSLALDVAILLKTVPLIFRDPNAY
ncbi:MAG: exopolysaccharide biosynthesis polyprenyl glycosylphosphotransferase [Phenylobacterium sp.]